MDGRRDVRGAGGEPERVLSLALPARRFRLCTTDSKHDRPVAKNLVNRDFSPAGPNRVWGTDITYVPTGEGWLYLAVVEDFYSRMIVGWATSARLDSGLAVRALERAVRRRRGTGYRMGGEGIPSQGGTRSEGKPVLQVHSDRGVQFASEEYRLLVARHGLLASMGRHGNCWDNAPVESFFATLKKELVYRREFCSRNGARASLRRYIEPFYNRVRRHSANGYASPREFERTECR